MIDDAQKFVELNQKRENLKTKKIRLEEQYKSKETELKKLVAELKNAGYQPNELKKVIDEKTINISKNIADFEKMLEEASKALSEIEEG